ncbi:Uncharacterised protein [Mycolicibacterium thermoresistibile]|nr:Uncharacterised protein [Mycolicibacterium thermoresistibile]
MGRNTFSPHRGACVQPPLCGLTGEGESVVLIVPPLRDSAGFRAVAAHPTA